MLDNMGIYEQALMESDPSSGGSGFELSTVQTLLTLYQKIIEYYSAVDNKLYIDIKNRMQALISRPEIEVLLHETHEKSNPKPEALEEQKVEFGIDDTEPEAQAKDGEEKTNKD